jgi:hypothetical protein
MSSYERLRRWRGVSAYRSKKFNNNPTVSKVTKEPGCSREYQGVKTTKQKKMPTV